MISYNPGPFLLTVNKSTCLTWSFNKTQLAASRPKIEFNLNMSLWFHEIETNEVTSWYGSLHQSWWIVSCNPVTSKIGIQTSFNHGASLWSELHQVLLKRREVLEAVDVCEEHLEVLGEDFWIDFSNSWWNKRPDLVVRCVFWEVLWPCIQMEFNDYSYLK